MRDRGRKSRDAATLCPGGAEPSAAGGGVAFLRRARQGAEVRHAVALRHGACAARSELPLDRKHLRYRRRRFSAATFLAVVVGIGIALLFSWFRTLEMLAMPLLVSLNMIPKVALGPLIIVWFSYGIGPNMMMAFAICFFPIVLTTARGLARGRARPARSGAHAERLALADFHQDPASRRAARTSSPA